MFDLSLTEEQNALKDVLHDIAQRELRPAARAVEAEGDIGPALRKLLWETGVVAPVPEDLGGPGTVDAVTAVIAAEELAWGDPAIAWGVFAGGAVAILVSLLGTREQQRRLLDPFVEGPGNGSVALAEPSGAATSWMTTTITAAGGSSSLSGTKSLVPDPNPVEACLCVARDGDVLRVVEFDPDLVRVEREGKLGLEGVPTATVVFEEMPVESGTVLDGYDDPRVAEAAVDRCRLLTAAVNVGAARAAAEYAATYATERHAFGRPIGAFQAVSFTVADMAMRADSARLLVWQAASAIDSGNHDSHLTRRACAHAAEAAVANGNDAVQLLGGAGYVFDHPVEKWYRDAQTLAAVDSFDVAGDAASEEVFA